MIMKSILKALLSCTLLSTALAAEPIEISFWEQDSANASSEMDKWIAVFQKKNPQYKVVRQHYENEQLRSKFLRSSVTGDGADIVYGPNDLAGVFNTAGVIRETGDLFDAKKFNPAAVDVVKLQGKSWGVPLSEGNHLMLFYNKDMVKTAPKDFNTLIEQGKKFTDHSKNEYGLAMFQSEPFWFVPIMGGFNAWPLSVEKDKIKLTIDTPETKKALQLLVDLKNKHKIIPTDCNYDCAKSMFLSGKSPFHINGDWEVNTLKSKYGDKLGIAPLPMINETGKYATPLLGGRFLFINKSVTKEKLEAVKKFIDFLTSKQVQVRMATKLDRIPATLAARNAPELAKLSTLKSLIEAASHAKASPSEVEMRAAWDGLRIMVQRALSGKETVAQAVKTGQKAADEALSAIQDKPKKDVTH